MKKGQVAIFILVGVFFVATLVLFAWIKSKNQTIVEDRECAIDADCVPSECCNADLCVPVTEAPDCLGDPSTDLDDVQCEPGCAGYLGDASGKKFLGCTTNLNDYSTCKCVNEKCAPASPY